jgi:hypothetical protein
MIKLIEDQGDWLISSYGANIALGFKGDPGFIERCYNWAVNTGVVHKGQRLCWFHEAVTGKLAYVCPKSVAAIERGLALQFRAEIIQSREIPPLKEGWTEDDELILELDEARIDELAGRRAKAFMAERLIRDSFVLGRPQGVGDVYSLGSLWRPSEE